MWAYFRASAYYQVLELAHADFFIAMSRPKHYISRFKHCCIHFAHDTFGYLGDSKFLLRGASPKVFCYATLVHRWVREKNRIHELHMSSEGNWVVYKALESHSALR